MLTLTDVAEIVEPFATAAPFALTLTFAVPSSLVPLLDYLTDFLLEVVSPLFSL